MVGKECLGKRNGGQKMKNEAQDRNTACELVLPLWSQVTNHTAQRCSHCLELFVVPPGMLFTNIQLDGFSATLVHLLEHLDIEEH